MTRILPAGLRAGRAAMYLLAVTIALVAVFPVYWAVRTAALPESRMYVDVSLVPAGMTLENYAFVLTKTRIPLTMFNTFKVALMTIVLALSCSSLAAFRFSRGRFPGRTALFYLFLGTMMIPGLANLVPLYVVMRGIGLMDTHLALVLLIGAGSIPMALLILRGFADTVPVELDESAHLDGCSKLQVFLRIVLPLMKPALAACSIIEFINVWNAFLVPMVFIYSPDKRLVMPAIRSFVEEHTTLWTVVTAGCVVSIIPVVFVFLMLQRYFIEGMTSGALKA